MTGQPDAWVKDAAVQEHRQANEADRSRNAASDHGQHLFVTCGHKHAVYGMWREQANHVSKEQEQDAEVEQVTAPAQQPGAQHLRRITLPRVLVAIKPKQAAQ